MTQPEPTTYVLNIIDASGSMYEVAEDVRGGYNQYMADLRRDGHRYLVTALTFNTEVTTLYTNTPVDRVPPLNEVTYTPQGTTALYDAIGTVVTEFNNNVTLQEGDKAVLNINTDGLENSSREYTKKAIVTILADWEAAGRALLYAGTKPDAWAQGGDLVSGQFSNVQATHTGAGMRSVYRGMSAGTVKLSAGSIDYADFGQVVAEEINRGAD